MDGSSEKTTNRMVTILPNYKIGKTLGYGSFAKVKLALHVATGHKVAIKILNRAKIKNMGIEIKVQREIKILRLLMHPHIIRQYEVIETPDDIYVVMEYVKSGELFDYIIEKGRLQEDEARHLFQQIISGVEYCHRNMIVHRDLKPENMLLDSKCNIKIVDFGLSNVMHDGHFLKTSCGSPNYAAPEVISGKPYSGPEVDIWSCGVILYALLCGTLPFDDENIPTLFDKIKKGMYTLPDHLSYVARDLIPRMLMVDPLMRISITEIRQHPWFNNHLPFYLYIPPLDTIEETKKIDEEIIQKVVNIGFDRNQVVESLVNRIQNEATVAYHLILDNRNQNCVPKDPFQSNFKEISGGIFNSTFPVQNITSHVGHLFSALYGLKSHVKDDKTWTLGLQSQGSPHDIMNEIFKALQNLKVCWKKIGLYNIKCRRVQRRVRSLANYTNHTIEDECAIIKFELQLYKVREGKYLLDIQRIDGPQFIFFDLCVAFLRDLGVV
ncbi:Protein kinase domain [Arabidopsis thaliana x Arabidopsis arenosa]|uniref:Protein kinase domain n=1 Tax=Arabidopsis thaliana x Arabidopsis arenosa TaxID=1240361 RepID=A0A8T1YD81_9BRAS|nr:Protein kinase domain [Arabidopsis thaliana x Arabidopsis arenosa]